MSTIVFRNAVLLVDGVALHTALHDLAIEYGAEMLDETCFGDDTRVNRGGLFNGSISGAGFFDNAVGTEEVLFGDLGNDDVILAVFPDGVTEGSTAEGRGYAMKGVLSEFALGGTVGELLPVSFAAQSRGIEA